MEGIKEPGNEAVKPQKQYPENHNEIISEFVGPTMIQEKR